MEWINRLEQELWYSNKFHQGLVCRPSPSTVHKNSLKHINNCVQTAEQRKLDAVCQRKKRKTKSQEERLDDLQHITEIPYITINTLVYIWWITPLFHGLKIGWKKQDHEWLTTRAHSCARKIDDKCRNIAYSHVTTWLFELNEHAQTLHCIDVYICAFA